MPLMSWASMGLVGLGALSRPVSLPAWEVELVFSLEIPGQIAIQAVGVAATWVFSFVGTFIILKVIDATVGLRVSKEEEIMGLDLSQHSERAYG